MPINSNSSNYSLNDLDSLIMFYVVNLLSVDNGVLKSPTATLFTLKCSCTSVITSFINYSAPCFGVYIFNRVRLSWFHWQYLMSIIPLSCYSVYIEHYLVWWNYNCTDFFKCEIGLYIYFPLFHSESTIIMWVEMYIL